MTTKPTAGSRIKAANAAAPYLLSAACSSPLTSSGTTLTDIPGCSITITTANANASVQVMGVFDITTATASSTTTATGSCVVDGAVQGGVATFELVTLSARASVSQTWNVSLATAGTHTIKLQGSLSAPSGSATYNTTHTNINLLVLDW